MGWGWDYVKGLASKAEHLGGEGIHGAESAWNGTVEGFEQAGKWLEDHPAMATAVRPHGTNGYDIYLMFHGPDVKGTGSIDSSVAGWRKVSSYHQQAGDALKSATSKLGVAWQGQAAESAGARVVPLREAADAASQQARQAGTVLETQSSGWNDTAHKVTNVPADPPRVSIVQVDPITPVRAQSEATAFTTGQQANQQALTGYGATTSLNTQSVPQFAPPAPKPSAQPGGGYQSDSAGGAPQGMASISGSWGSVHASSGPSPAGTHSSWQVPDTLHRPDAGQATPQQGAVPVAGAAAGAAGLIAGGGALMGGSVLGESGGGSSIGARLAGGSSGIGGSSTQGGSRLSGGRSGSGAIAEEAETVGDASTGRSSAAGVLGARRRNPEKDTEHENPDYLVEANPHGVFGADRHVAPPIFGEEQSPPAGPAEDD